MNEHLKKKRKRNQDSKDSSSVLDMDYLHSMVSDQRIKSFLKSEKTDPTMFPLNTDTSKSSNGLSIEINVDSEETNPVCHFCHVEQSNKENYVVCTNSNCKQVFCIDCIAIMNVVSQKKIKIQINVDLFTHF